ncbi:hypothetical protein BC830DRAFT_963362 [Chytriomyces sp. MP71]|nr:hypothetical protein BC830DRAFT_963362 [Chytriomyces sp. MP71]
MCEGVFKECRVEDALFDAYWFVFGRGFEIGFDLTSIGFHRRAFLCVPIVRMWKGLHHKQSTNDPFEGPYWVSIEFTFLTNRPYLQNPAFCRDKPYKCEYPDCNYSAKQKCSLSSHKLTHLTPDEKREVILNNRRTLECRICGKLYKNETSLDRHSWKDHGGTYDLV